VEVLLKVLRTGLGLVQAKKLDEALHALERAMLLDIELGSALKDKIVPQLADIYVALIESAMLAKEWEKAGTTLQALRRASPAHPKVEPLSQAVDQKARELLSEAMQLRELTPMKARRLLKTIIGMLPANDPTAAKAKEQLAKPTR